tara:strand:- start:1874 stop:2743 length:870 start_codon:yes stop_codon:yes gene_type:complete
MRVRVKFDEGDMMPKSHNKKRNVGIIFEQLVKYASTALVENNQDKATKVLKITSKYFKSGTELYREYRLFNALHNTTMPSESLATRIIGEAKGEARNFNSEKLYKEKSSLIHEINYSFNDPKFYSQRVSNYKSLATIQRLLESWRNEEPDIDSQAIYEAKLHNWLLQEKRASDMKDLKTQDVDNLTVSIMTKKFNESFTKELLPEQASLLQDYVFSIGKEENISEVFQERKNSCLQELKNYSLTCDSDIVKSKISLVTEKVENLPTSNIDDEIVSRYLTVMKLSSELRG